MISCMSVAKKVMLKEIKNKYGPKNVVLSPLSINVFLNMLASGSSGTTLEQFLGFLRCKDLDDLHSKSLTMMSLLVDTTQNSQNNTIGLDSVPKKRQGKPPLFNCVNALWVDYRYRLKPSYQEITNSIYKAQVKNVDLVNEV